MSRYELKGLFDRSESDALPDITMQCRRKRLSLSKLPCIGCGSCGENRTDASPKTKASDPSSRQSSFTGSEFSDPGSIVATHNVASATTDLFNKQNVSTQTVKPAASDLFDTNQEESKVKNYVMSKHHGSNEELMGDLKTFHFSNSSSEKSESNKSIKQSKHGTFYTVKRGKYTSGNRTSVAFLKAIMINTFLILFLLVSATVLCSTLLCKNDSVEINQENSKLRQNIPYFNFYHKHSDTSGIFCEGLMCEVCRGIHKLPLKTIIMENYLKPLLQWVDSTYVTLQKKSIILYQNQTFPSSQHIFSQLESFLIRYPNYLYFILPGCGLALAYVLFQAYQWQKQPKEDDTSVENLVKRIIDVLMKHEFNLRPPRNAFLSVDSLRDHLIAPYNRKRLQKVWDDAVRYIERNLSDSVVITYGNADHPIKVMRYSRANFQEMHSSINLLKLPSPRGPSSCLKVEYKFNIAALWGEGWTDCMKKYILERDPFIRVLHVCVVEIAHDEGSMYFKCASKEDAGKLHRFLEVWFIGERIEITYYSQNKYNIMFHLP